MLSEQKRIVVKYDEKKIITQEQNPEETSQSVLIWILASILLHLLLMLISITYKFHDINLQQRSLKEKEEYTPYILMQDPKQQQAPAQKQAPTVQEKKEKPQETKKAEEKPAPFDPNNMPLIIPGKAGIDHQDLDGKLTAHQNIAQKKSDNVDKSSGSPTQKPSAIVINEKTNSLDQSPDDSLEQETAAEPAQEDQSSLAQSAQDLQQQTQDTASLPQNHQAKQLSQLSFSPEKASFLSQARTAKKVKKHKRSGATNSDDSYAHVPEKKLQQEVKTMSFKDLGFGHASAAATIGNSSNLGINGLSPDIPTGEQLRYVTYLNKMSQMLNESYIYTLQINNLMNKRAMSSQEVTISMTIDRSGKLLDCHIVHPNKIPQINVFIVDVVKNVGLFNKLPNFYQGDTFRQIWTIRMLW